ncbi:hypothetical protein FQZ97_357390 [compost metagenome]
MQVRTQDDAGRWFTPETLSARQRMTPEGFLLCEAVPIARTGTLIYDESEVPVDGGAGGLVTIERNADEVFRPETLASFEGKPVTLSHPDDFVNPSNWRQLSVGITQNVRRGTDVESDLMLADLLITDAAAIALVRSDNDPNSERLRQVSCGYDADYEQLAPGRGRQTNIVGNHVALVERGRCGPRCAIGDSETMSKKQKRSFADRLRAAFMSKDAEAAEELAKEAETADEEEEEEGKEKAKTGDSATLDAIRALSADIKALTKRVGDMEAEKAKETEDEEEEESETMDDVLEAENAEHNSEAAGEKYTGDSAAMVDLRSRAEILVPGIAFGTRDSKMKVADHICACQRQALTKAMATDAGKALVEPFLLGRALDKLTADQVASAFIGASELAKVRNNDKGTRSTATTKDFGKTTSIADINRRNREHWTGQVRN